MTAEAPRLPTSRTMADWLQRLRDWHPVTLCFGCFVLHRVEVSLIITQAHALDPLSGQFLGHLSEHEQGMESVLLESLLGLNSALTRRLGQSLQNDGLIVAGPRQNSSQMAWLIAPAGKQALKDYKFFRGAQVRRVLTFVEDGNSAGSAQYVNVECSEWGAVFAPGLGAGNFDPANVVACIQQSSAWKQRRGFPTDIFKLCTSLESSPPWKHVIIDRPEQCGVLLLYTAEGLLGFPLQLSEWSLREIRPCFNLSADDGRDCFPDAAKSPTPTDWMQAWLRWGREHKLPNDQLEACTLELDGPRLRLNAPSALTARIAALLSDDDGLLLAGTGAWKSLVRLELET